MQDGQVLKSTNFVIQKYLEKPHLIQRRKYDIRLWVSVNQEGKTFICREGYIRTSSDFYTLEKESLGNVNMHLTNNAVQKNNENYGKFEEGNILSFAALQQYLDNEGKQGWVKGALLDRMKEFVEITLLSVADKLRVMKNNCFELFGFDFIIDANY